MRNKFLVHRVRMEKFAVDLEKVLDEFEFNEEREERVPPSVINNQSLSYICHASPVRPVSYRRPSFEPINLADADFAASPPAPRFSLLSSSSSVKQHGASLPPADTGSTHASVQLQSSSKTHVATSLINSRHLPSSEKALASADLLKQRSLLPAAHSLGISPCDSLQDSWSEEEALSLSEEKPDLIDCDKVKQAENSSITSECGVSNRLPDVTTSINNTVVHNLSDDSNKHLETAINPVFDLIDSSTASIDYINNGINQCNNINSSININNINNKVNSSFVVEKLVTDDYNNSVVEIEDNRFSNEATNSVSELIQKDVEPSSGERYFPSLAAEVYSANKIASDLSTTVDQQIGALRIDNNNGDDYISDPSCVEISFVEESEQIEKEKEEEKSPPVDFVEIENYESRQQKQVENLSNECLNVEKEQISALAVNEFKKESSSLNEKEIIKPIEEGQNLVVDESVPVCEIKSEDIQLKEDNLEPTDKFEIDSNECEPDERPETLVRFKPFSEPCKDEELAKYLEELEILEKEEKEQALSEQSKVEETQSVSKHDSAQDTTSEEPSTCSDSEETTAEIQDPIESQQNLEKSEEPASKNITRSLSDFIEKDIADEIKEESTKELQVEIGKENALLDYCNSNRQHLSSVGEESQFAFSVSSVECGGNSSKLNSVCCSSGSESFNGIKPLECQVAVVQCSEIVDKQEFSSNLPANSLENAIISDKSESLAVDSIADSESSTDSSSSESDTMGNTTEKITSSSAAASETMVSQSAAVGDEGGWSSSSEDVKTDEARLAPAHPEITEDSDKPSRPNFLELPARITIDNNIVTSPAPSATPSIEESEDGSSEPSGGLRQSSAVAAVQHQDGDGATSIITDDQIGKVKPLWVPDIDAPNCMQCQLKFGLIKRRHHCRACGKVLCSKCCSMKAKLLFMEGEEARVCQRCYSVLERDGSTDSTRSPLGRQPNPNNPMEYCSTIPPLQQVAGSLPQSPPSVLVPVGVLKREGRAKSEVTKQVMFSDGIRPGGDLTELDGSTETKLPFRRPGRMMKRVGTPPGGHSSRSMRRPMDPITNSFIPSDGEKNLPPTVIKSHGETIYTEFENSAITSNQPALKFAINRNLFVHVKRVLLECCVNRDCWCITSEGLACVGQDEIILVLECLPDETIPPKDVFLLINSLFEDASKGNTVSELSFSPAFSNNLLGSKDHGGFLYIRPTYQCTAQLILPNPPYLVALLIHRWETPWARLFPIRLELRLGAEFRYYPCPFVSVRHRPSLYTDIGHTIISILADFRLYNYTLPIVRGLVVHMEDRQTTILIPRNRYDQVVRALNNSNDSVLPFGANFSLAADSHLVCMQSMEDENTYHTQAINIQNKPRKVTGASFVVFNGSLKTSGVAGKSSIVEDGLMVQVSSETMTALRNSLRDMHDYTITCGPHGEETVLLKWTVDDTNFNIGVKSMIDGRPLDGVPSMRVHSGIDFSGNLRIIRWTEVFILQSEENSGKAAGDPVDISRLSESLAQATCLALVPFLDLLAAANINAVAVRANIHPDNVGYEAGSNGERLPPIYMKTLDDELVAVVHEAAVAAQDSPAILELVFRVMES